MAPRTDAARLLATVLAALLVACGPTATIAPRPRPVAAADATPSDPAAVESVPPFVLVLPAPSLAAEPPAPSPAATLDPPVVAEGPFEMDLFRDGDFVTEATKWYCVPAAMLVMINIMSPGAAHSRAAQTRLYRLARRLSPDTLVGRGAEPLGWARGLEARGFGAFEVGVHRTRQAAIQAAARAIRLTGRPAGLLVWRGAHSWVMSGFRATADPAATDDFTVTHVYIEDVWYPQVSSIWGKSRPPDSLVPVGKLKEDYLKWRRPTRRYPGMDGKFVTILPVDRD